MRRYDDLLLLWQKIQVIKCAATLTRATWSSMIFGRVVWPPHCRKDMRSNGSDKSRFMDFDIFSRPYRHSNAMRFTVRTMGLEDNIPVLRIHRDGAKSLDDSHSRAYASEDCVF